MDLLGVQFAQVWVMAIVAIGSLLSALALLLIARSGSSRVARSLIAPRRALQLVAVTSSPLPPRVAAVGSFSPRAPPVNHRPSPAHLGIFSRE